MRQKSGGGRAERIYKKNVIKNSNILKRKWINRVVFLKYFINISKGDFLFLTGMKIKWLLHIRHH